MDIPERAVLFCWLKASRLPHANGGSYGQSQIYFARNCIDRNFSLCFISRISHFVPYDQYFLATRVVKYRYMTEQEKIWQEYETQRLALEEQTGEWIGWNDSRLSIEHDASFTDPDTGASGTEDGLLIGGVVYPNAFTAVMALLRK